MKQHFISPSKHTQVFDFNQKRQNRGGGATKCEPEDNRIRRASRQTACGLA